MASAIKGMVSKNKIRYKEDGFDLDLSYISKNIIAMGFPAETLERFYRNHIDDVVKFFDLKHPNRYKIYNLCSESKRRYDTSKFHGPVNIEYSFQDHNPPPFAILKPFCESVHKWLKTHSQNVAGIHCKAGKGRTGVMICSYLVHAGGLEQESGEYVEIKDADSALDYYGRHRTHDSKGVTIPSQKRYVYYYEELVKRNLEYQVVPLKLSSIILTSIPVCNSGSYTLTCEIHQVPKQKIKTYDIEVKKSSKQIIFNLDEELCVTGDLKLEFWVRKIKKEKIFQFCFNTFFVGLGIDAYTVSCKTCSKCNGDTVSVLSSKSLKNSPSDQSVIDLSFLNLVSNTRNENFRYCDCHSLSDPADSIDHSDSTARRSSNKTGLPNYPPNSLSSSASLNDRDNKQMSLSSSSASSTSSSQSLNRKLNDSYSQLSKPELKSRDFFVVLPKDKLDKAYKDKTNKVFSSDFRVVLCFNTFGIDAIKSSPKLPNNCDCVGFDASSTDSENYSEDDEDISDLDSSLLENNRKSQMLPFANFSGHKKGETTHL